MSVRLPSNQISNWELNPFWPIVNSAFLIKLFFNLWAGLKDNLLFSVIFRDTLRVTNAFEKKYINSIHFCYRQMYLFEKKHVWAYIWKSISSPTHVFVKCIPFEIYDRNFPIAFLHNYCAPHFFVLILKSATFYLIHEFYEQLQRDLEITNIIKIYSYRIVT